MLNLNLHYLLIFTPIKKDDRLIKSALKNIVAFFNSDGGTLWS